MGFQVHRGELEAGKCAASVSDGGQWPHYHQCHKEGKYGPDDAGHYWCGTHAGPALKGQKVVTLWSAWEWLGKVVTEHAEFYVTPKRYARVKHAGEGFGYESRFLRSEIDSDASGLHSGRYIGRSEEEALARLRSGLWTQKLAAEARVIQVDAALVGIEAGRGVEVDSVTVYSGEAADRCEP